jgi:hypothetical protein
MANYLIVCGGTGRGILNSISEMGFVAGLQIDVMNQVIQSRDGLVQQVVLPLPEHRNMTSVGAVNWMESKLKVDLVEAKAQLAELAVSIADAKAKFADLHSLNDDRNAKKLYDINEEIESLQLQQTQQHQTIESLQVRIMHAAKAKELITTSSIVDGMSQAPIVGRSYIELDQPTKEIRDAIQKLYQKQPKNDNAVTFWIVASMCGGTGQGIYMHVIDQISKQRRIFGTSTLKVKVVRIGSLSYKSINPQIQLNAFWSLGTDFGKIYQQKIDSQQNNSNGENDYELNYYYLDLEDVGTGTTAIKPREEIVKTAFRAITQRELDEQFTGIFNNLNNAPKVVMTRMGEWGKEFDDKHLYAETVSAVNRQLNALIDEQNTDLLEEAGDITPEINIFGLKQSFKNFPSSDGDFKKITNATVLKLIKSTAVKRPISDETVESFVNREDWKLYTNFVKNILGDSDDTLFTLANQASLKLAMSDNSDVISSLSGDLSEIPFSQEYLNKVRLAKYIIVRTNEILFKTALKDNMHTILTENWVAMQNTKGLVGELLKDDDQRISDISNGFVSFLEAYTKILRIIKEFDNAKKVIEIARNNLREFRHTVNEQAKHSQINQHYVSVTETANLDTSIGSKTWLQHMIESLQGSTSTAIETGSFKKAVLLGAQGLTEEGLKRVMGMPSDSSIQNIVDVLNRNVGTNPSTWFQDMDPDFGGLPDGFKFKFRVFPRMSRSLFGRLEEASAAWSIQYNLPSPDYIRSSDSRAGLRVIAVETAAPHHAEIRMQYSKMTSQLIAAIDEQNTYFIPSKYVQKNCMVSTGTPVFLPGNISSQEVRLQSLKKFFERMKEYITVVTEPQEKHNAN